MHRCCSSASVLQQCVGVAAVRRCCSSASVLQRCVASVRCCSAEQIHLFYKGRWFRIRGESGLLKKFKCFTRGRLQRRTNSPVLQGEVDSSPGGKAGSLRNSSVLQRCVPAVRCCSARVPRTARGGPLESKTVAPLHISYKFSGSRSSVRSKSFRAREPENFGASGDRYDSNILMLGASF